MYEMARVSVWNESWHVSTVKASMSNAMRVRSDRICMARGGMIGGQEQNAGSPNVWSVRVREHVP